MKNLPSIAEQVHQVFEAQTHVRDKALEQARSLTRESAHAIRAIHRGEDEEAHTHLRQAQNLVEKLKSELANYPMLYYAGYTQDAIKEYAEASITVALIQNENLPSPEDLQIDHTTYIRGLSETPGELRRRALDILRHAYTPDVERLLACMDDIYAILVTMDYPDAVTQGLRRQTDLVRGILEKTRGDLTMSLREEQLKKSMEELTRRLDSQSCP